MADLTKQLIEQVKTASDSQSSLRIQGGGTRDFLGRKPSGSLLSLSGHTGIVHYDPGELVVTVRAGTSLRELEEVLAKQNQVLPFEPPRHGDNSTIGGAIACNLSGPARPWAGSGRDLLLGLKLIDGNGTLHRFGGQVMKNVAGYDATRLQCGAMGAYGVITEVSLKVMPAKPACLCLVAPLANTEPAIRLMNEVAGKPLPVSGAVWEQDHIHFRLEGGSANVKAGREALQDISPELGFSEEGPNFWTGLRDQSSDFFQTDTPVWRFSIKSTANHFMSESDWLIDWAGNLRWLKGTHDMTELAERAKSAGGSVTCFRNCDRNGEVFQQPDPVTRNLQSRLKTVFDPQNLFNPGRLYSWL